MTRSRHILTLFIILLCSILNTYAQSKIVYEYKIDQEIGPGVSRLTEKAVAEAESRKAAYILIDMDTYGGAVDAADVIRTALLKTKIPTIVFIRNNAASAGALISIACDSIYMSPGSTIGAAAVVNQNGEIMPEKYQSYMREKMRATAEQTGRDPLIAEGMTDGDVEIDSVKPKGKIVTFSPVRAIQFGYCNGIVEKPEDILPKLKGGPYVIETHKSTLSEMIVLWLINPAVSGILLLIIFGGIYLEFKTPGTFLPIVVSLLAAALYFAPLYLEGLAANWEILMFVVGVAFVLLEIFVFPGHGVALILGIMFAVCGLALALVRNINFDFTFVPPGALGFSFLIVSAAMAMPLLLLLAFGKKLFSSGLFRRVSDVGEMRTAEGYSVRDVTLQSLIGTAGTTLTKLRPAGKVEINGEQYDSIADGSFIEKNVAVKVKRVQATYLVVEEKHL